VRTEESASPEPVRLDSATIETLAQRIAELLTPTPAPRLTERPAGGLLSAAEVSSWCGVSRGWVYQHAAELGAVRIGDGERPRLRFDPNRVTERLNQLAALAPAPPPRRRRPRSPQIPGLSPRLAFVADPELSSPPAPPRSPAGRTGTSR